MGGLLLAPEFLLILSWPALRLSWWWAWRGSDMEALDPKPGPVLGSFSLLVTGSLLRDGERDKA